MRRYETILITHVDLSEDELSELITRYGDIVKGQKGILVKIERWGKRRLAYLINKQARGYYILIDYAGVGVVVDELERNLKIDDKILKFMTILKADKVDPAALEMEMADAVGKSDKKEAPVSAPEAPPVAAKEAPVSAPEAPPVAAAEEAVAADAAPAEPPVRDDITTQGDNQQ
ncbi:MAG: 30S ribosomal protein S6 [Thermodesulfobacteriota bacterium]